MRYAKRQIKKSTQNRVNHPRFASIFILLLEKIVDSQDQFMEKTTNLTVKTIEERENDFTKHIADNYRSITNKYSPDQKRFVYINIIIVIIYLKILNH